MLNRSESVVEAHEFGEITHCIYFKISFKVVDLIFAHFFLNRFAHSNKELPHADNCMLVQLPCHALCALFKECGLTILNDTLTYLRLQGPGRAAVTH